MCLSVNLKSFFDLSYLSWQETLCLFFRSSSTVTSSEKPLLSPQILLYFVYTLLWMDHIAFRLSVYMARKWALPGRTLDLFVLGFSDPRVSSSMKQTFSKFLLNLIKRPIEKSFSYMFSVQFQFYPNPNLFRWQDSLFFLRLHTYHTEGSQ